MSWTNPFLIHSEIFLCRFGGFWWVLVGFGGFWWVLVGFGGLLWIDPFAVIVAEEPTQNLSRDLLGWRSIHERPIWPPYQVCRSVLLFFGTFCGEIYFWLCFFRRLIRSIHSGTRRITTPGPSLKKSAPIRMSCKSPSAMRPTATRIPRNTATARWRRTRGITWRSEPFPAWMRPVPCSPTQPTQRPWLGVHFFTFKFHLLLFDFF